MKKSMYVLAIIMLSVGYASAQEQPRPSRPTTLEQVRVVNEKNVEAVKNVDETNPAEQSEVTNPTPEDATRVRVGVKLTEQTTGTQSRVNAAAPYKPAVPEKGQEEEPPIKRLTGYEIKPEDVREGRITLEGEKRIIEHLRNKIAKERFEAVKEVYRRGVPYLLVDHGKITVKLAFYTSLQEAPKALERSPKPPAELSAAVRPGAIPLKIEARVVNEKNIEALGREAGAFGEIEISFKVDLR